jgi:hypothetical protein
MGLSVYSSPYYLDNLCPFYGESPAASSQILPDLVDHDYGLEPSPSTSYSEMIHTLPSVQTAPLPITLDFMEQAYPRTLTCPPNTAMGPDISQGSGICMVQHRANRQQTLPHPMPYPHEVLDCPLTTGFVSPLDTLPGHWVPNRTAFPAPESSPKLHQHTNR